MVTGKELQDGTFKDGFRNEINLGFQLSHHSNQYPGFLNAFPAGVPQPPLCPHTGGALTAPPGSCPSRDSSVRKVLFVTLRATFLKFPSFQVLPSSWWPQRYLGMVTMCIPTISSHGYMTGVYQEQWEASEVRVTEKNGLKALDVRLSAGGQWKRGNGQDSGSEAEMDMGESLEGTGEGPWGEAMSGWHPQFPGLFVSSHGTPDENSWLKMRKAFWELQAPQTDTHDSLVSWSGYNRILGTRQAQDNRNVLGHSSGGQKSGSR